MKSVFYAGSFNPFTEGHADIVKRLLSLADEVIIGIGVNLEKPESSRRAKENSIFIDSWIKNNKLSDRIKVVVYDGLTGEEALTHGADCLARGVRNSSDFDYEYSLASVNRDAFGLETLLIPANPSLSFVSSSMLRDIISHGKNDLAEKYLPK